MLYFLANLRLHIFDTLQMHQTHVILVIVGGNGGQSCSSSWAFAKVSCMAEEYLSSIGWALGRGEADVKDEEQRG